MCHLLQTDNTEKVQGTTDTETDRKVIPVLQPARAGETK